MILTIRVQQQIVQLQITINNPVLVQILQTKHHACGIKDGTRLRKHVGVNVHHQITTGRVFHYKTNMLL